MNLTVNIEVRRHNGQCGYGPWMSVDAAEVPEWVQDMIGDEIAENDWDAGTIEQAGSVWAWCKS